MIQITRTYLFFRFYFFRKSVIYIDLWFVFKNKMFLYSISESGDLTINKVQAQMEGDFECRASNSFGEDIVKANLKVVQSTTIISGTYSMNENKKVAKKMPKKRQTF